MSGNLMVCNIDPELKEKMKAFCLHRRKKAALIMKIDQERQLVIWDESYEDISTDDLREKLPKNVPRYVVYSYVYNHDDGRVSHPMCFVFISPSGTKPELQMIYSGSKVNVIRDLVGAIKVFELRNVEELTEEWLKSKLAFFR